MGTLKIKIANLFAKNSCSAWQSKRFVRKISRQMYRFIMETGSKTYPYAEANFANWPESDEEGKYSLITDSDNFVIRRSPSYIAWIIKQTYGSWPKLPTPGKRLPGEHKFDAKHWDEILEFNKWCKVKNPGTQSALGVNEPKHFIGVIADEGEFGQLVWYEGPGSDLAHVKVSTYKNFQKAVYEIMLSENIIWYREPSPAKHCKS